MNFTSFDKAIVGGIVSALVAFAARFGWQPNGDALNAANVLLTLLVPYAVAHIVIYLKANKPKGL